MKMEKLASFLRNFLVLKKVYLDITYVVEDYAINYTFHGWETFIKDIIEHEQPKVLLINAISNPREYAITDL